MFSVYSTSFLGKNIPLFRGKLVTGRDTFGAGGASPPLHRDQGMRAMRGIFVPSFHAGAGPRLARPIGPCGGTPLRWGVKMDGKEMKQARGFLRRAPVRSDLSFAYQSG